MSANAASLRLSTQLLGPGIHETTLLDLVGAVCEATGDDEEAVATVLYMLRSGRVRLCGNFRGQEKQFTRS